LPFSLTGSTEGAKVFRESSSSLLDVLWMRNEPPQSRAGFQQSIRNSFQFAFALRNRSHLTLRCLAVSNRLNEPADFALDLLLFAVLVAAAQPQGSEIPRSAHLPTSRPRS
jgi:hypothetical protein